MKGFATHAPDRCAPDEGGSEDGFPRVARDAPRRRQHARGLALAEVLVVASLLTVSLLGHAASILSSHQLGSRTNERARAVQFAERTIERLRADPEFATLYARLRGRTAESASDAGRSSLAVDPSLAMSAPSAYYADLVAPPELGDVRLVVQVPVDRVDGTPALREDVVAPRYGLPHDLDGDGRVDGLPKDGTHLALPVVVRVRWARPGGRADEVVIPTWLRGER